MLSLTIVNRVAVNSYSGFVSVKSKNLLEYAELQTDYVCPVSRLPTAKCPNHVFGEFCHNMKLKRKHRILFYSFMGVWS